MAFLADERVLRGAVDIVAEGVEGIEGFLEGGGSTILNENRENWKKGQSSSIVIVIVIWCKEPRPVTVMRDRVIHPKF